MSVQKISNAILGVGVDDTTIDLFESQYRCLPASATTPMSFWMKRSPFWIRWTTVPRMPGWQTSPKRWATACRNIWWSPTWSRTMVPTLPDWPLSTRT